MLGLYLGVRPHCWHATGKVGGIMNDNTYTIYIYIFLLVYPRWCRLSSFGDTKYGTPNWTVACKYKHLCEGVLCQVIVLMRSFTCHSLPSVDKLLYTTNHSCLHPAKDTDAMQKHMPYLTMGGFLPINLSVNMCEPTRQSMACGLKLLSLPAFARLFRGKKETH